MVQIIIPSPDMDAPYVTKKFRDHVYQNEGLTKVIISDTDRAIMSKSWSSLFQLLGKRLKPFSVHQPQTDIKSKIDD